MMTGSEFARTFGPKGLAAWEAAALRLAQEDDGLTPWPFVPLTLSDDKGNTAVLQVQVDDLSIGPIGDHLRLPLTPTAAQSILNLRGWLLPTPWLVYQIWRASPVKATPRAMVPNQGASMAQYAAHSAIVDQQIGDAAATDFRTGIDKSVVVSNIMLPGKVVIFGWYRPDGPDVFDDRRAEQAPNRQPIQPKSNIHGAFYVDYSHGIRAVGPVALVNGQPMPTVDLYQSPTLSHLVSNEGPVRTPRYPSPIPPSRNRPAHVLTYPTTPYVVTTQPGESTRGIGVVRRG